MFKLAPSILSADFARLGEEMETLRESGADYVHIDVMDGLFVPNISMGFPVINALRKLPGLTLDVHLMIDRPIRYVERFCDAGADLLTIHTEADTQENTIAALKLIREKGVRPAVSIKPGTPVTDLIPFLPYVDMVLFMTVEPGFGGQKFMSEVMPKIAWLRDYLAENRLTCEIEVDGGINEETVQVCKENGANVFVAGSAFFRAKSRKGFAESIKG